MTEYFKKYTSNCIAGCANQHYFETDGECVMTSRAYFKIANGGEYDYSLLFSGILDGNFRRISYANEPCGGWTIHSAVVGRCRDIPKDELCDLKMDSDIVTEWLAELTFSGERRKTVEAELFYSDPVRLLFNTGEYLALEITYSGKRIPCHPECMIPIYKKVADGWVYDVEMPLPSMIGCTREVRERVAFLGDSITQGCGSGFNEYKHWNARLSEMIGGERAFWNLGIGYGTATSAASDGVWLLKAKQSDTVFVCYGVNDINSFHTADEVIADISTIIDKLRLAKCKIILQTVPPFDYPPEKKAVWCEVNERIKKDLSRKVDFTFDCVPLLSIGGATSEVTRYGGHPNAEGCAVWAEALWRAVKPLFEVK